MTVKLSPQKVRKIVSGYFSGIPQMKIAKKSGVDQSSVSHYASRFRQRTAEIGIVAAGKEYEVYEEVTALRSLSVELAKVRMTVEEAREGVRIMREFDKLGVYS